MAARVEEERDEQPQNSSTPTRTQAAPTGRGSGETTEVSLTQFRMQFPDLVSVAQGG